VAFGAKGSAQKTPKRTRSAAIIRPRRDSRSTSGAAKIPTSSVGRMSAISSALIHSGEWVRLSTSICSATSASQVPSPEPSVARKSERKPGSRPRSPRRRPVKWRLTASETLTGWCRPERGVFRTGRFPPRPLSGFGGHRLDPVERVGEKGVLLGGADRHTDRRRAAKAVCGADDHTLAQQLLEQRPRVLAQVAVEEVRHGRPRGLEPVLAQDSLDLHALRGVLEAAALDLLRVAEARERGFLCGRRDVEGAPHLAERGH